MDNILATNRFFVERMDNTVKSAPHVGGDSTAVGVGLASRPLERDAWLKRSKTLSEVTKQMSEFYW